MRRQAYVWAAVAAVSVTACSAVGDTGGGGDDEQGSGTVVLVTHDSFALSQKVIADFEAESGLTLETRAPGDAGALVNQLVLTKDSPLGDAVYGIDNTFGSRAVDEGVLADFTPAALDQVPDDLALEGAGDALTPVDFSDVCVNVDHDWFEQEGIEEPRTLDDLTDPAYADLLVVTNPATSSPGLAFLLATVDAYGDDWRDYWADLRDNGVKVVDSWSDAYFVDFSGSSGEGPRPLALSYASSPPAEASGDTAPTGALLDTCYRQVEYAGVLAGADNPEGAQEVVDFLLSREVQEDLPGKMYVYPAVDGTPLPPAWQRYAPLAPDPYRLDPAEVDAHRSEWIDEWTDTVIG